MGDDKSAGGWRRGLRTSDMDGMNFFDGQKVHDHHVYPIRPMPKSKEWAPTLIKRFFFSFAFSFISEMSIIGK